MQKTIFLCNIIHRRNYNYSLVLTDIGYGFGAHRRYWSDDQLRWHVHVFDLMYYTRMVRWPQYTYSSFFKRRGKPEIYIKLGGGYLTVKKKTGGCYCTHFYMICQLGTNFWYVYNTIGWVFNCILLLFCVYIFWYNSFFSKVWKNSW